MRNNTKTTTFSAKKVTHAKQHYNNNIWCKERSHMQNNTKTTTFSVKKVTHAQQH